MKIILIGSKDEQRVIHWPGVACLLLLIAVVGGGSANLFYFLISGGMMPWHFTILIIAIGTGCMIGRAIGNSRRIPVDQLPMLN
ncbi:MAG: hypothetical protein ACI9R3_006395 [Verrucomicrobiales bacterium]|jgi:hypothetical protein